MAGRPKLQPGEVRDPKPQQQADGTWSVRAHTRDAGGTRRYIRATGATAEEAVANLHARARQLAHETESVTTQTELRVLLDAWIAEKSSDGVRPQTVRAYRDTVRWLAPLAGALTVEQLTPQRLTTLFSTWRIAGCRDWFSKIEHPFHTSPTANQYDAIAAVELALADYERMFGHPLVDTCPVDEATGEVPPVVTLVTDNGGPFRSLNFELFIMRHPELRHVRTRVKSPGQNGSRERGFGTLKYERLFLDDIPDALELVDRAEAYRIEYNTIRPHEAIAWNRPLEVHLGLADPTIPNFEREDFLPTT